MSRDHVDRLTVGQRDVLRRVNRHMETKEIARELGISPDGVNQRIKAAMRTLGVNKRRDAALLLAEAEGPGAYQPLVNPPRDIAHFVHFTTFVRAASTLSYGWRYPNLDLWATRHSAHKLLLGRDARP